MTNIISPSTTYKPQSFSNVASLKINVESDSGNNSVIPSVSVAESSSESFEKNVLQSLQNLGLNTTDVNGEALQVFVQDLYKAMTESSPAPAPAALEDDLHISGGTNFKYAVDLSEADLGDYLADVKSNIKTALDNIGQHISSKIVFNLKVYGMELDSDTLAQANTTLITTTSKQHGVSIDTSFVSDSIQSVELSPDTPDARLYINKAKMNDMSFSGEPVAGKYDLTSILTHEILHGVAFAGSLNGGGLPLKTAYDELTSTQDTTSEFMGRHAQTVNFGDPVPLASSNAGEGSAYYHVAMPNDLMSASLKKGEVKSISPLDVAMLEDMGLAIIGDSPTAPKLQMAYSNPSANLQNLMNSIGQHEELQNNFTNLVASLGDSSSPSTVNLKDFLQQLAANTGNSNSPQNGLGSIFTATA